jgi:hypothetical protein
LQPWYAIDSRYPDLGGWSRHRHRLPGAGCYQASYPSTAWQTIACVNAPRVSYPLPKSRRPHGISPDGIGQSVGNGADFTADTTPSLMSSGIGAFPAVTGVTSVQSVENPEFGCCGENGTNSYTLQLNSYFFTTSACGNIPNCAGWEQFVYENPPGKQPESCCHSEHFDQELRKSDRNRHGSVERR